MTTFNFQSSIFVIISVNRDLDYFLFSEIRDQKRPPPSPFFLIFVYGKGVQNASLLIVIIIK